MKSLLWLSLCLLPLGAFAQEQEEEEMPNNTAQYGIGVICPHPGTQVTFYTQSNLQEASGTIAFQKTGEFVFTSHTVKNLKSSGAKQMDGYCENAAFAGIRIDKMRDGWMRAGNLWLPPGQEWEFHDWFGYLKKSVVWKPIGHIVLYQGNKDGPFPDKPYTISWENPEALEIIPIQRLDNTAYVLVDEAGSFKKTCAGQLVPPSGKIGWMKLTSEEGDLTVVPAYPKGCE